MRTNTLGLALLGVAVSTVLAAPQDSSAGSNKTELVKVAFGQQIQTDDQTNHWVAWIEGSTACPPSQILGTLVNDPCGQRFDLPGSKDLEFAGCDNDGLPHVLLANGKFIRTCKESKKTLKCVPAGSGHDVVKRGKCTE